MMRIAFTALMMLSLSSCGSHPGQTAPQIPARPEASAAAASSSQADRPEQIGTPTAASSATAGDRVDMRHADWTAADEGVDGWLHAKGVEDTSSEALIKLAGLPESVRVECDRVVPVGKPIGQAALCRRQYKDGVWVLVTSFLLLVPEGGRLRKVWEVPAAVGQLSRVDAAEAPFVQLNVSIQDDGMLLFMEETEGLGCGDWRVRLKAARQDAEPEEADTLKALERVAPRVCQSKGRYAWRGTTFGR